jgi:signal transduction histidine kinase
MNLEIERSRNMMVSGTTDTRDVVRRAAGRIQTWFRRRDQQQLKRELNVRLEERRRERARIARELHDTLFQGFLGASLQIHDAVNRMPADSPGKPSLNRALRLMQRAIDEGRETLVGIHSSGVASMSLEQALSGLRDEFAPCGEVQFRIFVKGQPKALNPVVQEQISLIGREALANSLRHSKATSIEAEVEYLRRRVRVVVRDNGCGIDPELVQSGRKAHWGLVGMRERAGSIGAQLRIWSRPGAGTEVEISVPDKIVAAACA